MRVLVCGGRDYGWLDKENHIGWDETEHRLMGETLSAIAHPWELICGMAFGADTMAYNWAKSNGIKVHEYPADWDRYGKRAGYIRNKQMLDEGTPDLVIAFPGGKGTKMMVELARKANVEVIEIG